MHERTVEFVTRAEEAYDLDIDVHEFPEGTKTAGDAAEAIGCDVAQIASSIVIAADEVIVVVTSGANRVDLGKIATLRDVGRVQVSLADADTVRETLGWSIGGVPPFCHGTDVTVYLDETLLAHPMVWAAAGTPRSVFPIAPERIREIADAIPAAVAE